MRNITIILSDSNMNFNDQNLEIYKFNKNKSDLNELKKIVIDINKSPKETVYLITNKEDLFEFFNRKLIIKKLRREIINGNY
ncbi:hypothetical protein [Aliarcobacter butzleri]|uniref:hypothetical protein n=1 Tax=Aliarcobacter butzleri TaxID=28197 RepID=UPI0021B2553A|nr:hypothetical protein [Aliarcobacter butzleri]MCT7630976.1 hypothetical protein [Aliarcobacter butzleri]MCT7649078.1 hypothetical protein [Aliarcobacter butzleri]MDS1314360.1 hypothetical protein [Aliarcobacter butzleri]